MSRESQRQDDVAAARLAARNECDRCDLVYSALREHTDSKGLSWPSKTRLMEQTALKRYALDSALRDLTSLKLIGDTGKRRGATKQVIVWKVRDRLPAGYVPRKAPKDVARTPLSKRRKSMPRPKAQSRQAWKEDSKEDMPDWAREEEAQ